MQAPTLLKDLVLVGGGHTHVHVLKSFGLKPMPGARLTLIGRDVETPYSGMIPGFVAGHYTFAECHIDLAWLCASNGARLIQDEAIGIDRASHQVLLKDGPAVSYDLLSIDVGSAPNLETIPGARQWATPVKPIAELGRHWMAFVERMRAWLGPLNVTVIGGGAGGVELALAIDHGLREAAKGAQVQVTLATKDEILAGQGAAGCGCSKRRQPSGSNAARCSSRAANGCKPTPSSSSPRQVLPNGSPRPACRSTSAVSSPSRTRCARRATSGSSPSGTARRC